MLESLALGQRFAARLLRPMRVRPRFTLGTRFESSGQRWRETVVSAPSGTGGVKSVAIGDIDGDGRADLVVACEHAVGDKIGVYWLQQDAMAEAARWPARDIAGAPGIKFDLVRLLDLDGDGDLDVLTNEEQQDKRGLGVMWYEHPQRASR